MAEQTPNYNLNKINLSDAPPDITILNPNFDTIDTEMHRLSEAVGNTGATDQIEQSIGNTNDTSATTTTGTVFGKLNKIITTTDSNKSSLSSLTTTLGAQNSTTTSPSNANTNAKLNYLLADKLVGDKGQNALSDIRYTVNNPTYVSSPSEKTPIYHVIDTVDFGTGGFLKLNFNGIARATNTIPTGTVQPNQYSGIFGIEILTTTGGNIQYDNRIQPVVYSKGQTFTESELSNWDKNIVTLSNSESSLTTSILSTYHPFFTLYTVRFGTKDNTANIGGRYAFNAFIYGRGIVTIIAKYTYPVLRQNDTNPQRWTSSYFTAVGTLIGDKVYNQNKLY